jgi:hypothetical protein
MLLSCLMALAPKALNAAAETRGEQSRASISVYIFWQEGCPHCARALDFLRGIERARSDVRLKSFEVSRPGDGQDLFLRALEEFDISQPAVPLVIVGDKVFLGYGGDATTGRKITAASSACQEARLCPDVVGGWIAAASSAELPGQDSALPDTLRLPEAVAVPVIGEVSLENLSLPMLTVVLAAADGFNPCAMWVLIFLIGLLLGLRDRRRMWILGGAFLLASAAVYFVFLAAWLNVMLLVGAMVWVRLAVGLLAVAAGAAYLREFALRRDEVCEVASENQRRRITTKLRAAIAEKSLVWALPSIVTTAMAVNLVELLCSAGLPAIYTEVLSLTALPAWQYYGYLLLYVLIFLLDDLLVFVTAMVTLRVSGLTGRYSRYAHLIGGLIITMVGLLLLFHPEWLNFQ